MFLIKIFYFFKGYAIIGIKGTGAARLASLCRARKIMLWNVDAHRMSVFASDVDEVITAAKKVGATVEILSLHSFRESFAARSGWICVLTAALFLSAALLSSGYVWSIETEGCGEETAAAVLSAAEKFGLRVGARKIDLPDGDGMRDGIIYTVDGVSWAWVYLEGTHARIRVMEKIAAPPVMRDNEPGNIAAAYDGILYFVSAKRGRALLAAGDRVSAGEVVITGEMPESEKSPAHNIRAEGEVYARTVRTAACEYQLTRVKMRDTGRSTVRRWISVFGFKLPLYLHSSPGFESYRTEVCEREVGLCGVRYIETEAFYEQLPEDTAVSEAVDALGEKIAKQIQPGSRKTDERVAWQKTDENKIKVTLSLSFIENIGQRTPIRTEDETDK